MDEYTPLYNSRIAKLYLEYIIKYYPDIDIDSILNYAGMTLYEVEDPAHWFNQIQNDRFHDIVVEKTGHPNISRDVGRYLSSAEGIGALKQYALGLMSLRSVYSLIGKLMTVATRATTCKTKLLGPNMVDITFTPLPGVNEKPFQCQTRTGTLEAIGKFFTKRYAQIEHPSCVHKGNDSCQYIITWYKSPSLSWQLARNYLVVLAVLALIPLILYLKISVWLIVFLICFIIIMGVSYYAAYLKNKDHIHTIESQGDAAKDLIDETSSRYNNALLIQEIGQATSAILEKENLISKVMGVMKSNLDFDRGLIMLADEDKSALVVADSFGYTDEQYAILDRTEFYLNTSGSIDVFADAFNNQKPLMIGDIDDQKSDFSDKSLKFIETVGSLSLLCVPIIYENESLGIIFFDTTKPKRDFIQSDINLLMGIASQIATGIMNAVSFQKLQESQEALRKSHDELEMRVEQRTRELREEIAERKIAEKQKEMLLKEVQFGGEIRK